MSLKNNFLVSLGLVVSLSGCSIIQEVYDDASIRPQVDQYLGPVARSTEKFYKLQLNQSITLDASPSYHTENNAIQYQWKLISAPQGYLDSHPAWSRHAQKTSFTPTLAGNYTFQIIVSDDAGHSAQNLAYIKAEEAMPVIQFLAIGDMGTGEQGQVLVANAMKQVCDDLKCDFVMGLGDNIYDAGVKSVNDEQFNTKFELPYKDVNLPFYMALGNHDNSGLSAGDGSFNYRGDLQVLYARDENRPSKKWKMPARYYHVPMAMENDTASQASETLLDLVALDSTTLTSLHDPSPEYALDKVTRQQSDWINTTLHTSQGHWRIAFAHHPYLSNGKHGNAGVYDKYNELKYVGDKYIFQRAAGVYYEDFLEKVVCDKVDLYISGHDHSLQDLNAVDECGKTQFIVSGAAAKTTKLKGKNKNYWESAQLGFFHLRVENNTITIKAYTVTEGGKTTLTHERVLNKS
ncbi:MAG: metallophosphoesterase [Bermanella sp.]